MELYVKRLRYIIPTTQKIRRLERAKIHSGFQRSYGIGIDCVVYHREDCVIPVYVRGNFCPSSSKEIVVDYGWNMNSSNKIRNAVDN